MAEIPLKESKTQEGNLNTNLPKKPRPSEPPPAAYPQNPKKK